MRYTMSNPYLLKSEGNISTRMTSPWNPSDLYCATMSPTTMDRPSTPASR
jgi:hypothetical protein